MSPVHFHLIGGPYDGQTMEFQLDKDDLLPEILIIPTSTETGELYELAEEDASCGYPRYLYGGYDWEPLGDYEDWEEE